AVAGDLQGVTVHEAARVLGVAEPGEILVTSVTRDLVGPEQMRFDDRGEHRLKGLSEARRLFAVVA
ncbi:MAG TPA: adenylate/guanylate cyclase domain-containing protein, partial [Actinomycetota bacterium]|nr:adenylate/guanylate cyclase domain-containing protein [Actinomycetota bacterium]